MKANQLSEKIGFIGDDLITEAQNAKIKKYNIKRGKLIVIAASLILVICCFWLFGGYSYTLKYSSGNITVKKVWFIPKISSSFDLVNLSEEELFTAHNTVIFEGTVEDIQNIVINFNGNKDYRAIAKIKVQKIYRGELSISRSIKVLLPCSVGKGIMQEDTGVISSITIGTKGIFMPLLYDDNSYCTENGATFYYKDIADYGFLDGERYAFLETKKGIRFDTLAYSSIANANTINEIESYVEKMIQLNQ